MTERAVIEGAGSIPWSPLAGGMLARPCGGIRAPMDPATLTIINKL
jgi:hypothetical protein